jgi:hypothetical protein
MVSNKSLDTFECNGYTVMDMGDMEIWDGADLSLIREMFTRLVEGACHRHIGIDMKAVKYIPSGFFGLLFDWHEQSVGIRLYSPQPHVRNMLWFRQFFVEVSEGSFELCSHEVVDEPLDEPLPVNNDFLDEPLQLALDASDSHDELSVAGLTS